MSDFKSALDLCEELREAAAEQRKRLNRLSEMIAKIVMMIKERENDKN